MGHKPKAKSRKGDTEIVCRNAIRHVYINDCFEGKVRVPAGQALVNVWHDRDAEQRVRNRRRREEFYAKAKICGVRIGRREEWRITELADLSKIPVPVAIETGLYLNSGGSNGGTEQC